MSILPDSGRGDVFALPRPDAGKAPARAAQLHGIRRTGGSRGGRRRHAAGDGKSCPLRLPGAHDRQRAPAVPCRPDDGRGARTDAPSGKGRACAGTGLFVSSGAGACTRLGERHRHRQALRLLRRSAFHSAGRAGVQRRRRQSAQIRSDTGDMENVSIDNVYRPSPPPDCRPRASGWGTASGWISGGHQVRRAERVLPDFRHDRELPLRRGRLPRAGHLYRARAPGHARPGGTVRHGGIGCTALPGSRCMPARRGIRGTGTGRMRHRRRRRRSVCTRQAGAILPPARSGRATDLFSGRTASAVRWGVRTWRAVFLRRPALPRASSLRPAFLPGRRRRCAGWTGRCTTAPAVTYTGMRARRLRGCVTVCRLGSAAYARGLTGGAVPVRDRIERHAAAVPVLSLAGLVPAGSGVRYGGAVLSGRNGGRAGDFCLLQRLDGYLFPTRSSGTAATSGFMAATVPTPEATAEFGDETALLPDGGRLLAVHLRACGRIGSSLKLYVRYDGESSWQLLGSVAGSGREELIRIPVPPRPCRWFRFRLNFSGSGAPGRPDGAFRVSGMWWDTEQGGARFRIGGFCFRGVAPLLSAFRRGRGLAFSSPAYPAFRVVFAPIPRPPSPVGKGETKVIYMQGLRPLHPGAEPEAALTASAQTEAPAGLPPGGVVAGGEPRTRRGGGEVACRLCHSGTRRGACLSPRPPTLPLALFLPPIPHPPSPVGKGGD